VTEKQRDHELWRLRYYVNLAIEARRHRLQSIRRRTVRESLDILRRLNRGH
jgi:hypothetical protein